MSEMFVEKLEFLAQIESETKKAKNLQASVSYRKDEPAPVVGFISGDIDNYRDVERVINSKGDIRLRSTVIADYGFHNIVDSDLIWRRLNNPSIRDKQGNPRDTKILDFELLEFVLEDEIKEYGYPFVTYHLFGPTDVWPTHGWTEASYTGERKIKDQQYFLNIDSDFVQTCEIYNHYFWDKIDRDGRTIDISTSTISVNFRFQKEFTAIHGSLLQSLDHIVKDLLIVASFIGRGRVDWYMRESILDNVWQTKYRYRSFQSSSQGKNRRDLLADIGKIPVLLQQATKNFRHAEKEVDLEVPIRYLLMSQEALVIEQKFALAFLGLEKLIDEYYKGTCEREILEKKEFDSLEEKFREIIQAKISDEFVRGEFYSTLLGLNRRSMKNLIEKLLSNLSIDWRDLYPSGKELSIANTRNKLFHQNIDEEMDIEWLWKEAIRTQRIVERIILKLLDWSDFSMVPSRFEREWLQIQK